MDELDTNYHGTCMGAAAAGRIAGTFKLGKIYPIKYFNMTAWDLQYDGIKLLDTF